MCCVVIIEEENIMNNLILQINVFMLLWMIKNEDNTKTEVG